MGFFDFVKNVGKKLVGASEAQAAPAPALTEEVASHGFDTNNLQIQSAGNEVKVTGQVKSQEDAERIILALGNTVGVANVDTSQLVVNATAPAAKMYTVKKGDTLWKIAEEHYGKGADYPKIVAANNPPIVNPDLIQPGWVLRIP
ncbi:peptidoglycan-binding protein LysM [Phreatobacter stygius]|uniref:Peptidoglycan-binding protein LysM n=1 Tax=Phreatobacter stygius TaxID=1940610 RepID=A0A4D7BCJ9_9HYPH|nr:peptidoglycan-binding protein LysM [Phreatobacter stygius]QCI68550.1 peptidoglycan-binding protein LysM [Phreatobacter stygius]